MKLVKFEATNIHGYLNINLDFNNDLSILIGENGSGKTTALKLMQALISPSFKELIMIEFEEIVLTFQKERNKKNITLKCEKSKDFIYITSSEVEEILMIENIEENELQYLSNTGNEILIYERIQEMPLKYRKHPIVEYIISLSSPIFLGLERKFELDDFGSKVLSNKRLLYDESYNSSVKNRRLYEGNLNSGLADAQVLIQDFYRNIKNSDQRNIDKMKENLLLSSFKYREFRMDEFSESLRNWKKKRDLLNRKDEVLEVLSKIEDKERILTNELNKFFDRLNSLMNESSDEEDEVPVNIELIFNMAQIDKIFDLVTIVQTHKERTDKMYSKVYKFLEIINDFYIDSHKYIELDSLGKIIVKRVNGNLCPVSSLSSGERQLLVIFAHAFFNKPNTEEKIFIIDEPELSLHLRWQQTFISTIIENSPKTQFIMATHSPDIVDDFDEKIINNWRK